VPVLPHVSKWYGVKDAKIAKLTADPAGGSPTYATSIDVPGIKRIGIGGSMNNKELRGDNQLLDSNSVMTALTAQIEHAKLNLDAMAVMEGSTVTDSGTTPNQLATLSLTGAQTPNYFKVEAQVVSVDAGIADGHLILWKCILTDPLTGGAIAEEDYSLPTFAVKAIPLLSNNKWRDIVLYETATAIP
jgi:hypothetical protein